MGQQTTSDLSKDHFDIESRSARFQQSDPDRGVDAPTSEGAERRAEYRPPEPVARRRKVLEAFRTQMLDDAAERDEQTSESARALQAAVVAEEVLGEYDKASRRIHGLSRLRQPTLGDRRIYRRILRATDGEEAIISSLERSVREADEPQASHLALEGGREAWRGGAPAGSVHAWLDRADGEALEEGADWSRLRRAQLRIDTLLEEGRIDGARKRLAGAVDAVETSGLRSLLQSRLALLDHLCGDIEQSRDGLAELSETRQLEGDLNELLVFLAYETGDASTAQRVIESVEPESSVGQIWTIPSVMGAANPPEHRLEEALGRVEAGEPDDRDDRALLKVRQRLLERAIDDGGADRWVDELIDVLNRRLDSIESEDEQVAVLTKLGECYERHLGIDEAAAEVYREALEIAPGQSAAVRALGRLYARQQNWKSLAALYEHELEHLDFSNGKWRHHFRVAELYEQKLSDRERALAHYRKTIGARPTWLPALKGAARMLSGLDRWTDLTDLFLSSVDRTESRRQKLYLLDRAAEVAEQKLDRPDIAIGAWEELLSIDGSYPRAFAALGRLYSQTGSWEKLLELNDRELELVDGDEEAAALYLRNAQICERRLDEPDRAVEHYRRALTLVPDYVPALEGLGRLYARAGRWDDIVRMTERELGEMADGPEATRQLGALAEIVDRQLGRSDQARRFYETVHDRQSDDVHVRETLVRHYRRDEDWEKLVGLLEARAADRDGQARADVLGEIAMIQEWRADKPAAAFEHYMRALDADPGNVHWLEGVSRTWSTADIEPDAVANRLEDKVVEPVESPVLDRYFKLIARLRERGDASSSASRAHRLHGARSSRENQTVLQFEMAQTGERESLERARRKNPHHDLEALAQVPRTDLSEGDVALIGESAEGLAAGEREAFLGELSPAIHAPHVTNEAGENLRLSADLQSLLDGEGLAETSEKGSFDNFPLARLRGVVAFDGDQFRTFKRWTYDEISMRRRRDDIVERLIRLAVLARRTDQPGQAAHMNRQAAIVVFASLERESDELHPSINRESLIGGVDEETIDRLYESLRDSRQWELFTSCLRAHVAREGLTDEDRVALFTELAEVSERRLDDLEGAVQAVTHCWQISEDPEHLRELVRLDELCDERSSAIRHQRRHFDVMMVRDTYGPDAIVESGLQLAELLLGRAESFEEGIAVLEDLRDGFPEAEGHPTVLRRLAHAYADAGDAWPAVEAFQAYLGGTPERDQLEDWRQMVELYESEINDPQTAYELQWRVLEAFPRSESDLERLVALAFRADDIAGCVDRLEERAEAVSGEDRRILLERAARVADEDLQLWEEADRLYGRVLELVDDGTDEQLDIFRRKVLCLSRIIGREEEAMETFGELLERDPFEPSAYRAMLQLFEREKIHDRVRLTQQVLEALNCEVERSDVRTKMTPARAFDDRDIEEHLLPDVLPPGVFRLLEQTVPLAEKVLADDLPQKKTLDGVKLRKTGHDGMLDALEDAAAAFGMTRYRAELGDSGPPAPQVFGSGNPDIWFNEEVLRGLNPSERVFTAGYVSALGATGLAPLMELDGRRVWHLIEGTWLRQQGEGFDQRVDVRSQEMADAIGSPFLAVARRRVVGAAEPIVDDLPQAPCELWSEGIQEFACRVGLVLCGDLAAAIRCLLRFGGWNMGLGEPETREQVTRSALVGRLIRFAFSEDYLEARYAVGLSGRPSELSISS